MKIGDPVEAVLAWGIYKDYDRNAPDVAPDFFTTVEEVRTFLIQEMNKLKEKNNDIWVVDGSEWCAHWTAKKYVVAKSSLLNTIEEANQAILEFTRIEEGDEDE